MHRIVILLLGIGLALNVMDQASAQEEIASSQLEAAVVRHFQRQEYRKALDLIEAHLKTSPNDLAMLYNAACGYSRLNDPDRAAGYLQRAVSRGFIDFDHMEADPDLEPLRDHPLYLQILEMRDEAFERFAERQLEYAREYFGEDGYRYEVDESRHLNFATALDATSHAEMRQMLEEQTDYLVEHFFEAPPSYYVIIAIPTPDRAARMLGDPEIGGIYEHTRRRLISRDTGYLLRHEFTHLLHYGHMERLGQDHPLWLEEALATLFENYELASGGDITFTPNVRHNIAKRRARVGRTVRWERLLTLSDEVFMAGASHLYPQVRSMFRYLAHENQVENWYRTYVETYDEDLTGALAFEQVFDKPLAEIERDWKRWLADQPLTKDAPTFGGASLGIEIILDGSNDGVLVDRLLPGSGARGRLRVGDVIVSIDGRATRSFQELGRIIAGKDVGDLVKVRARRNGRYFEVTIRLTALRMAAGESTKAIPGPLKVAIRSDGLPVAA